MHEEFMALAIAAIGVLGLACQWLAWRLRLPAILFLLIAGLVVGPLTGWLQPQALLGELLFPLISLAVAVILFEGSLTLNFKEIRGVNHTVWSIVSLGALVSWGVTSAVTHYLLGFDWSLALLFGSLTVVTGPTVIVPLLRTVRPNVRLSNILRWEGILIDPLGALFVVMVYEFIVSSSEVHSLYVFALILAVGLAIGAAAGQAVAVVLRRGMLPEYLQPFAVLAVVLGVFSASNAIESESGLLTVTVMGMWLANAKNVNIQHILHFKENLTILLITGLFILLAARIEIADFQALGWSALLLFVLMQLVSRPLSIFIATARSSLSLKEKTFLAWVAPRGIVAASISSLFAIKLTSAGVEGATLLVPLTFMVIIGTVILQSATARPIAIALQVAEPAPRGFLVIGANDVARELGKAFAKYDCRVVLTDSNWDYISQARMAGLANYYGNPISSHADEYLDLIGIGHVVALTPDKHFNIMACMHFLSDFGEKRVFCLNDHVNSSSSDKHKVAQEYHGLSLFNGEVSYKKLASLINQGAEVKHTKLSGNFTYQDYLQRHKESFVLPLFVVNLKGRIQMYHDTQVFEPVEGETIVSLIKINESH
ncbi:cation:proton antiporter [Vibrio aestuarianus]|uniref:Sodium:proton antiporter n=1 Tax=Vibrio aestuarianus TaxID=28171 RepID=A0ABN8TTR1_9VIBR|nr:sodium:proton antiporter [Vibrio aestuarianus]MDE1212169.1 cation:proton antiporter [Vibrio aestuarianus]MDE1217670.1 cation:proton antiporter [Vibrio aestuarianus]MDE1226202.1 cation:proton antiporter [Vibrio aestuarianus]MDE1257408.1 cation:proton antiporter [Vibrio aestuarianus]MDE1259295.1 cation:proton antiporter [Vibrio aestuarianus]